MITTFAFFLYTIATLLFIVTCGPLGPFFNYLIAFSASSIGFIITLGKN